MTSLPEVNGLVLRGGGDRMLAHDHAVSHRHLAEALRRDLLTARPADAGVEVTARIRRHLEQAEAYERAIAAFDGRDADRFVLVSATVTPVDGDPVQLHPGVDGLRPSLETMLGQQ